MLIVFIEDDGNMFIFVFIGFCFVDIYIGFIN